MTRRQFAGSCLASLPIRAEKSWRDLFDGSSLRGWHAVPRLPVAAYPGGPEPPKTSDAYRRAAASRGKWGVRDGAIVGGQDPPGSGLGGYLLTDDLFGDFELSLEANPDWGVDTGALVRATAVGSQGFQIHVDHRTMGSIGTFYGNGIGGFRARQFAFVARRQDERVVGLQPAEVPEEEAKKLSWAAPAAAFFDAWRFGMWNTLMVRVTGRLPRLTTWVNGFKIAELDAASLEASHYDPEAVAALLGPRGHIALEVHNSGSGDSLGAERWLPNAVCRWRNIRVREI